MLQREVVKSKENYRERFLFAKLGKSGRAADFVEVFG